MKGKNSFTKSEISELRKLIKERTKTDSSKQKGIRDKMRKIGFYGSDDFGITDLQLSDFEQLINSGRIKVLGQNNNSSINAPKPEPKDSLHSENSLNSALTFTLFDPEIHSMVNIPDNPGNYIVCLKKGSVLPDIGVSFKMNTYHELNVIYTGIAGRSLRNRDFRQHFTGNNAGTSTLRKSLGSMFGYTKIARDRDPSNGKTKFMESDEIQLSEWMKSNLVLYFLSNFNPKNFEDKLIRDLNPLLNLSKNAASINIEFRNKLSELRKIK